MTSLQLAPTDRVVADPLVGLEPRHRPRPALRTATEVVTYGELDDRVGRRAAELADSLTSLHPVAAGRDVESVVELLAAWRAGRPVLMLPSAGGPAAERLLAAWPPAGTDGEGYDVHPDLALLMSTSGTTGSPKLVRISHANLRSNASAIADYLAITPDDVALTTLPTHYCYGLSVLTSHLHARASLLLTDASVTSCATWELAGHHGVTSFAGVPHTFELLERSGQVDRLPASLRYVTQAGGRLAPDDVRRWARRGEQRGFDFVVMYGQTEATARMAWLPPALAADRPDAVGLPIPGGRLRIDPVDGLPADLPAGAGELVYSGANVMMGYAHEAADLSRGPELDELRTGDLAVQDDDGLFRVVGRLARFAKVCGLRVDLDGVERALVAVDVEGRVLEVEGRLVAFVRRGRHALVRQHAADAAGLPAHLVDVVGVDELPVSSSGKRDDAPLRALLARRDVEAAAEDVPLEEQVRATYALLLGRPDATTADSFVSLRGDSLSYVEANVRLAALLGDVPADWPQRTPHELAAAAAAVASERTTEGTHPRRRRPWSRWPRVDASLVLRAVAIVLIVGSHTDVWMVPGGAHTLLALAGFSLVRFQLSGLDPSGRSRRVARMTAAIVGPAVLVTGTVALVRGTYDATTVLGLHNLLGADTWNDQWRLWFVEAIGWGLLLVLLLVRIPAVDRLERRAPYLLPVGLLALTLVVRWSWIGWEAGNPQRYSMPFVWTFLLLGWLAARSETRRQKAATLALVLVSTVGFFGDAVREGVVVGALALLLWLPQVRIPARVVPAVGMVAASSLWVYLVHWEVYPPVEEVSEPLAFVASFASGIAAWWAWTRGGRSLRALVAVVADPARRQHGEVHGAGARSGGRRRDALLGGASASSGLGPTRGGAHLGATSTRSTG